jgi:hypothetical protein
VDDRCLCAVACDFFHEVTLVLLGFAWYCTAATNNGVAQNESHAERSDGGASGCIICRLVCWKAPVNLKRILQEGFVAGLIGAASVALWFLLVDTFAGRPFLTPGVLGSAVFWGLRDPAAVEITYAAVVGYTMIHVLAFCVIGVIAATLASLVEDVPATLFLVVVLFAVFEFGFYVVVAILAQPLLGALAWWNVAIGNLVAAVGMGAYLWRAHPRIRESLATRPLGADADRD